MMSVKYGDTVANIAAIKIAPPMKHTIYIMSGCDDVDVQSLSLFPVVNIIQVL